MKVDAHLFKFKIWFESRDLREKLLVCVLSWALLYAIFALILFRPLDLKYNEMASNIKKSKDQIVNWQSQLKYLKDIPNTPLYKEWVKEHQLFMTMKDKYKDIIGKSGTGKWDEIIKTVLNDYPNIVIEKIVNDPETAYQASKIKAAPDMLYQQQMNLTVIGNFQDIVSYLVSLEKALPTIHWDTLNYEVTDYPLARVTMEFSILYEKSKT